jgi:hypothetical protein
VGASVSAGVIVSASPIGPFAGSVGIGFAGVAGIALSAVCCLAYAYE